MIIKKKSCSTQLNVKFILLISVKMHTAYILSMYKQTFLTQILLAHVFSPIWAMPMKKNCTDLDNSKTLLKQGKSWS